MGIGNSVQSKNFKDKQLEEKIKTSLVRVRKSDDPCFGEITIFRRTDKHSLIDEENYIFAKTKLEPNINDYSELYRECEIRLNMQHDNLLEFLGYDFESTKNVCGQSNRGSMYYQYFERDIQCEISKRAQTQNYFEEKEVSYLLRSLISVGAYLQEQGIFHGDLRPINMFLTSSGQVKIGDHIMLNQYRNNYVKHLVAEDDQVFLSPELLNAIYQRLQDPEYNEFKSDVWSLGMTMLEICTLTDSIECYDYYSNKISYTIIQDKLSRVSQLYSFQLTNIIKQMLEEDERIRPDFFQLSDQVGNQTFHSSANKSQYSPRGAYQEASRINPQVSQVQRVQAQPQVRPFQQSSPTRTYQQPMTQTLNPIPAIHTTTQAFVPPPPPVAPIQQSQIIPQQVPIQQSYIRPVAPPPMHASIQQQPPLQASIQLPPPPQGYPIPAPPRVVNRPPPHPTHTSIPQQVSQQQSLHTRPDSQQMNDSIPLPPQNAQGAQPIPIYGDSAHSRNGIEDKIQKALQNTRNTIQLNQQFDNHNY